MLKIGLLSGSIFASLSIILGAFGAHALKDQLSAYSLAIYEKAVLYQMFHSVGILILGIINEIMPNIHLELVGWAFIIGTIIFCGSLYILAITGIKSLGMITPIGGVLFIIGW